MADFKQFIFASNSAGTVEGVAYGTEDEKWSAILGLSSGSTGPWYKSIIFREKTNEIYNRGITYGLSEADRETLSALSASQLSVDATDSALTIDSESHTIKATLSLDYDSTNRKINLVGKSGYTMSSIDASDFIKDGMLSGVTLETEWEEGYSGETPYLKMVFNTDPSGRTTHDVIRISLKSLVPNVYDGSNILLTSGYTSGLTEIYSAETISEGDSMDKAIAKLVNATKTKELSAATVTDDGLALASNVRKVIEDNEEVTAEALLDLDERIKSLSSGTAGGMDQITIAGQTLTKSSNTMTKTQLENALELGQYVKSGDTIFASGASEDNNITVTLSGTVKNPTIQVVSNIDASGSNIAGSGTSEDGFITISVSGTVSGHQFTINDKVVEYSAATAANDLKGDGTDVDGFVKASDIKQTILDNEEVTSEALNDLDDRIKTLEGDTSVTNIDARVTNIENTLADWGEY